MSPEEKLIDYLYGEMSQAERQAFEAELREHPALQKELESLRESRDFLSDLPDVQAPASIIALKPNPPKWRKWLLPAGIAASFLILLELFDFQVNTTENGFTFSFGETLETNHLEPESPNFVTLTEVQQLLDNREASHRKDLLLMDSIWRQRLLHQEQSLQKNLNHQLAANQRAQKADLINFTKNFQQEDLPELANLMQNLLNKHQQETKIMFGEAWANWQNTRANDLEVIRTEFANVYQSQEETDALLLNVIATGDDD